MMKKINEKELNMVTGGNIGQTAYDSVLLCSKGYMDEEVDILDLVFHWTRDSAKVDKGWARAGIDCITTPGGGNKYSKNGKQISVDYARSLI